MLCSQLQKVFFVFLFSVISTLGFDQDSLVWGLHGKTTHLSRMTEVAILENGDAAFCGSHDSLITFGNHSFRGPKPTGGKGATSSSVYVGRCSADKEIKWIQSYATASAGLYTHDLALDKYDNIWITASASGRIKFVNGRSDYLGDTGLILMKIDADGNLLFGKAYSGLGTKVHNYHVLPRDDGKCYFLGNHGSGTFGTSQIPNGSTGQYSEYIALVDTNGTPIWGKSIGGANGAVTASDFTFDSKGRLLISGNYRVINTPNIIEEGTKGSDAEVEIKTQLTSGDVGNNIRPIGSTNGQIYPFIGVYDPGTGNPIEVHCYLGGSGGHVTSMTSDNQGNVYAAFCFYAAEMNIRGNIIKGYGRESMAIVKFNSDWDVDWFNVIGAPGNSNYADDLCLDGDKLYAACMISQGRFVENQIEFTTKGLWSGTLLRLNAQNGNFEWFDRWEVGRALCVDMKDGEGYVGGWFHYTTTVGRDRLEVGQDGQFNAVLARIGTSDEEDIEPIAAIPSLKPMPIPEPELLSKLGNRPIPPSLPTPVAPKKVREIRSTETQHRLEVHSEAITIRLWDNRQVDGDIISLKYNGQWILEDFKLRRKPHVLKLEVQPGQPNFIEMYSEDVGSIPPTTTQISIEDGSQIQSISLRSTPETNGMIEIFWAE